MPIIILHNSRCSKSQKALEILREKEEPIEVIEYTKTPLKPALLKSILEKLNLPASAILRKKEANDAGISMLEGDELLRGICNNPLTMQRPIIISGNKAIIARPPEKLVDFLN